MRIREMDQRLRDRDALHDDAIVARRERPLVRVQRDAQVARTPGSDLIAKVEYASTSGWSCFLPITTSRRLSSAAVDARQYLMLRGD